jgi:hypothetical protein
MPVPPRRKITYVVPARVRAVDQQAHRAPPSARMKFRAHVGCLMISLIVLIMGLLIPLDAMVLTAPAIESLAIATVERLFAW